MGFSDDPSMVRQWDAAFIPSQALIDAHADRPASCLAVALGVLLLVQSLDTILALWYNAEATQLHKHIENPKISVHFNPVFDMTMQQRKDKEFVLPCTLSQLALCQRRVINVYFRKLGKQAQFFVQTARFLQWFG